MNTLEAAGLSRALFMHIFWLDLKAKPLVYFSQPVHPVLLTQSGISNSVTGLATFPTYQVQDYSAAAATEIVGRPLVQIKSHVKVQCIEWHTFSCSGSLASWDKDF